MVEGAVDKELRPPIKMMLDAWPGLSAEALPKMREDLAAISGFDLNAPESWTSRRAWHLRWSALTRALRCSRLEVLPSGHSDHRVVHHSDSASSQSIQTVISVAPRFCARRRKRCSRIETGLDRLGSGWHKSHRQEGRHMNVSRALALIEHVGGEKGLPLL
jgi:hypothetical protein